MVTTKSSITFIITYHYKFSIIGLLLTLLSYRLYCIDGEPNNQLVALVDSGKYLFTCKRSALVDYELYIWTTAVRRYEDMI